MFSKIFNKPEKKFIPSEPPTEITRMLKEKVISKTEGRMNSRGTSKTWIEGDIIVVAGLPRDDHVYATLEVERRNIPLTEAEQLWLMRECEISEQTKSDGRDGALQLLKSM